MVPHKKCNKTNKQQFRMGNSASSPPKNPMPAVVREGKALAFREDAVGLPPAPSKPDDILVKIGAAAINPVDYKAGAMLLGKIVGLDFAGTVEAVAEGATHGIAVGNRVYGTTRGSLATHALCRAGALAKAPEGLSFAEAAAMPTTYLTSHQALARHGRLKEGGRVLVIGASGGCGTAALQLARAMQAGAVVAVCSGKNAEYARGHGATRVVDYTSERLPEIYPAATTDNADRFDVVYDCATNSGGGEDYHAIALPLLCAPDAATGRAHGQYVAINGAAGMWVRHFAGMEKRHQRLFLADANTADLTHLAGLAAAKTIAPVIDTTYPFTAAGVDEAFAKLKSRRTVGKLVIEVAGESG